MTQQFTITHETTRDLTRRKEQLEREMKRLQDEWSLVSKQLEAIPLFLPSLNGGGAQAAAAAPITSPATLPPEKTEKTDVDLDAPVGMSMPMAVKYVLQKHGRLSAVELRDPVVKAGIPRERLGATYSYLYTVLGRLIEKGEIQKVKGKYQLPPGVTHQWKPDEEDVKR